MHTELKQLDGLKRSLEVKIPAENVDTAYKKCLDTLSRQVKLPGFRAGKVPAHVVESRFKGDIQSSVINQLLKDTLDQAMSSIDERIAGQPSVEAGSVVPGAEFSYQATFEVYPTIELVELSDVELEFLDVEVVDADVEQAIVKMQKSQATWESADRPAADGDKVQIDFVGSLEGEPFEGGSANDFSLELGTGSMIPGFESQLLGIEPGIEKTISVTFPEDYQAAELAGKPAEFKITCKKVESSVLPELNDSFASQHGAPDGIDQLKENVAERIARDVTDQVHAQKKKMVFEKLVELNGGLIVPESLVDAEVGALQKNLLRQYAGPNGQLPEIELPKEPFVQEATNRVKIGLLVSEFIQKHEVTVSDEDVDQKIESLVAEHGGDEPDAMREAYKSNKNVLNNIQSLLVEETVFESLQSQANVRLKTVSYEDFLKSASN